MSRKAEETGKLKNIIVFNLMNFNEQTTLINKLKNFITQKLRLLIFDTITNLYRKELWNKENNVKLNKELNRQVALIKSICVEKNVVGILLNQVRSILDGVSLNFEPVANKIINHWCDYNIEIINLFDQEKELNIFYNENRQINLNLKCKLTTQGFRMI
jgi:RecA/RadA recombinase